MKKIIEYRKDFPLRNKLMYNGYFTLRNIQNRKVSQDAYALLIYNEGIDAAIKVLNEIECEKIDARIIYIGKSYEACILKAISKRIMFFDIDDEFLLKNIIQVTSHDLDKLTFTKQDIDFMHLLSYGMATKEMSYYTSITERRIRRIKDRLKRKIGLKTTPELQIYSALYLYFDANCQLPPP